MRSSGTLLCLASAAAFGAMGVLGKLSYEEGATAGTLLVVRFLLAAALLWALLLGAGAAGEIRALNARDVVVCLALGACGYAAQAGGYFAALERMDVSLLSLLVYMFPAMVAIGASALGRERLTGPRLTALALASVGLVLVLAGAGTGALDPLGSALALAAAVVYSVYILAGERVAARVRPALLSALVCTGAAISLGAGSALLGQFRPGEVTAAGWGWLACLSVVSTVVAVSLFLAGLRRVGPTAAAILSTMEPVVAVLLAFLVLGEVLGATQVLGGALVLAAAVVLQTRPGRRAASPAAAMEGAPA